MYVVLFLSSVCPTVMQAGQVYGVSLSGPLLAKTGLYPEQKNCGEDFRNKWIEDLSQRKRLRALAEHVPHGYRKRTIFEALIKHDVPILRATWFVKIVTLKQVCQDSTNYILPSFLRFSVCYCCTCRVISEQKS
jgi:hypothetical protein